MENSKLEEIYERVYFKMLNFISYRQRSEKEISDRLSKYLSKYRFSSEEIENIREKVINRLEESGYLDDLDFAVSYVNGLVNSGKPVSERKIFQFLFKRGVSKEIINQALKFLPSDFILQSVLKEAEKKLKTTKGPDNFTRKQKLSQYLYRKGYPFEVITSVVDRLL